MKSIYLYIAGLWLFLSVGCYQPKEGCLDIRATNYDVSSDDPCADCCKYPQWSVATLHQVVLPTEPDTTYTLHYDQPYPSPFDTTHYFSIERCRFFLSNFKLIGENGKTLGISDSLHIESPPGNPITVENNFAKLDRDIFAPNVLGKILGNGPFHQLRFTLGLPANLLKTDPKSVPAGHPLSTAADSINYEIETGYVPVILSLSQDTLPGVIPTLFRYFETQEITLDLPASFELDRGFNLKLTLKVNYMDWFKDLDFQQDGYYLLREKIWANMAQSFALSEIKLE